MRAGHGVHASRDPARHGDDAPTIAARPHRHIPRSRGGGTHGWTDAGGRGEPEDRLVEVARRDVPHGRTASWDSAILVRATRDPIPSLR